MFAKNADTSGLDDTIKYTQERMLQMDPDTDEFAETLNQLEKLYKIRTAEKQTSDHVSKDVLLTVGANLFGILAILNYERVHVVTSKALSFVLKTKV